MAVVLGAFGPQMLRLVPPAALLVPVAGIGMAFLGLEQATAPFGAPLVGFMVSWGEHADAYAAARTAPSDMATADKVTAAEMFFEVASEFREGLSELSTFKALNL